MNSEWEKFLREQAAVIADGRVDCFADPDGERTATMQKPIVTDLSHYGVITATGEDAASFLQNQLINDVRMLNCGVSQLSGYCTPKGRLLSVFRLFGDGERYCLCMPADVIAPFIKRLQMFVLMSKVTLASDDGLQHIGVAGPGAGSALEKYLGPVPEEIDGISRDEDCLTIRLPGDERYEVHAPAEKLAALWQKLTPELTPVGSDAWPLLDIINGIPTVYEPTVEHFIPQMLNLELIGGVSFKKGCFPGQEVVARMHYRGQSKRRMFRFACPGGTPPAPGTSVLTVGGDKSREVGEVVDARRHPDGGCQGLAVLQTTHVEQTLAPEDDPGNPLKLLELPYSID